MTTELTCLVLYQEGTFQQLSLRHIVVGKVRETLVSDCHPIETVVEVFATVTLKTSSLNIETDIS